MFVEASKMGGSGLLTLTGQLGDVMKESATLALNWLRINTARFDLNLDIMEGTDIHIHFPAGAVEKDGPSAGVTIGVLNQADDFRFFGFGISSMTLMLFYSVCSVCPRVIIHAKDRVFGRRHDGRNHVAGLGASCWWR